MASKKAVLFDLDGTLIDTMELILESFRRASADVLGAALPDAQVRSLIGIPLIEQARILAPEHPQELFDAYQGYNFALHDDMVRYFEGTREMLEAAIADGRRLAVVTSKRNGPALKGLSLFGLQRYFEFIIGMEDTEKHKPDPQPLLLAAARMGRAADACIYVGDSVFDMQAARAAHMAAVAALWGTSNEGELIKAGAQYCVAEPSGLLAVFDEIG
ncbi:MAG: HAD-IA family hydrolase [Eggerthellaceae bacterium]|nr:HAD-IA family hydrolase [Eggerthellaceae bacterium]